MPEFTRQCVVCKKIQAVSKSLYFMINTNECEVKLRAGYRLTYHMDLRDLSLTNSYVHRKCYRRVTRSLSPVTKIKENMSSDSKILTDVFDDALSNDFNIYVTSNESRAEEATIKIFYYIPI